MCGCETATIASVWGLGLFISLLCLIPEDEHNWQCNVLYSLFWPVTLVVWPFRVLYLHGTYFDKLEARIRDVEMKTKWVKDENEITYEKTGRLEDSIQRLAGLINERREKTRGKRS